MMVIVVGLLALQPILESIPGRYRVALQERIPLASTILEALYDEVLPVAEALPVAAADAATEEVDIGALIAAPTEEPTVVPDPTIEPTQETAVPSLNLKRP